MNGIVKVTTEWINLNGAEVEDINGTTGTVTLVQGDEFYLTVTGVKRYGELGIYFWHGEQPNKGRTRGAETLKHNQQGKLVKGVDDIWVRGVNGPVELIIRKVQ